MYEGMNAVMLWMLVAIRWTWMNEGSTDMVVNSKQGVPKSLPLSLSPFLCLQVSLCQRKTPAALRCITTPDVLYACLKCVSPACDVWKLHNAPSVYCCMSEVVPLIGWVLLFSLAVIQLMGGAKESGQIVDLRQITGGFPSILIGQAAKLCSRLLWFRTLLSLWNVFACLSVSPNVALKADETPAFTKECWSVT